MIITTKDELLATMSVTNSQISRSNWTCWIVFHVSPEPKAPGRPTMVLVFNADTCSALTRSNTCRARTLFLYSVNANKECVFLLLLGVTWWQKHQLTNTPVMARKNKTES